MLNANYTICYKDVLEIAPDILDNIVWDTTEHTTKLKDMIYSKFFNYEISGETIQEFKLFMEAKFNQYKDYYAELLRTYEVSFDWRDGDVEIEDLETVTDGTKDFTPRTKYRETTTPGVVVTNEDYDLPRSSSSENHPSGKTVSTPTGTNIVETEGLDGKDTTKDDITVTGDNTRKRVNLVKQRKWYMESIRNVYEEFADKFEPCFCQLFA